MNIGKPQSIVTVLPEKALTLEKIDEAAPAVEVEVPTPETVPSVA